MRLCVKKHMHIDTKQYNRTTETLVKASVPVVLAGTQGPRSLAITGLAGQLDTDWTRQWRGLDTDRVGGPVFWPGGTPMGGLGRRRTGVTT
jgi:hypothetical protein